MAGERKYVVKEEARLELSDAIDKYLKAADGYEMGAQETADEISDIFHNQGQPYKVITND